MRCEQTARQAPPHRNPYAKPTPERQDSPETLGFAGPRTQAGVAEDRKDGHRNSLVVAKDHTSHRQRERRRARGQEEGGASAMARTVQGEEKTETPAEVRLLALSCAVWACEMLIAKPAKRTPSANLFDSVVVLRRSKSNV